MRKKTTTCQHCAMAEAKIKTMANKTDSPATHQGHILALDISYIQHAIIAEQNTGFEFMTFSLI